MNNILLNVLVAGGVGTARALLGYAAVFQTEAFDLKKFLTGVFIGLVGGGIAGAMANDVRLAVIGALGADDFRSIATNYYKNR